MNILGCYDKRTKKHKGNYVVFFESEPANGIITILSSMRQVKKELFYYRYMSQSAYDASGRLIAFSEAGRVVFL